MTLCNKLGKGVAGVGQLSFTPISLENIVWVYLYNKFDQFFFNIGTTTQCVQSEVGEILQSHYLQIRSGVVQCKSYFNMADVDHYPKQQCSGTMHLRCQLSFVLSGVSGVIQILYGWFLCTHIVMTKPHKDKVLTMAQPTWDWLEIQATGKMAGRMGMSILVWKGLWWYRLITH